jgi:hypothetical protein
MTLPLSGPLTFAQIQGEFGGTEPVALSEYYRGGALVPNSSSTATIPTSGAISVSNFYGVTDRVFIPLSISSSTYNYDVYANRGPSYVAGISDIQVTIATPAVVGSTSTGSYAMLVPNSFSPGDTVTIVNNGLITGMGGNGGDSQFAAQSGGNPGTNAGNALYINRPTTIQNNSVIAGGGGGGGGGSGWTPDKGGSGWGGGGGGGIGYNGGSGGGGPYPGNPGTVSSPGAGNPGDFQGIAGGAGGGRGSPGANGSPTGGANPRPGGAGGAGGYYIVGNSFVTWTATGTRNGPAA